MYINVFVHGASVHGVSSYRNICSADASDGVDSPKLRISVSEKRIASLHTPSASSYWNLYSADASEGVEHLSSGDVVQRGG